MFLIKAFEMEKIELNDIWLVLYVKAVLLSRRPAEVVMPSVVWCHMKSF